MVRSASSCYRKNKGKLPRLEILKIYPATQQFKCIMSWHEHGQYKDHGRLVIEPNRYT